MNIVFIPLTMATWAIIGLIPVMSYNRHLIQLVSKIQACERYNITRYGLSSVEYKSFMLWRGEFYKHHLSLNKHRMTISLIIGPLSYFVYNRHLIKADNYLSRYDNVIRWKDFIKSYHD